MALGRDLYQVVTLGGMDPKTLLRRVYREIEADNSWGYAAQLAYYFLFSLFPFFIFLTALLAYVPIPDLLDQIVELLGTMVPAAAVDMIEENIIALTSTPRGGLLSFGILLALWTASSAMAAIGDSLNRAYGVKEGRPFWKVRGVAILLTIGLAVMAIMSMVLLIVGPELSAPIAEYFGVSRTVEQGWLIARWPIIVVLMIVAVALVYYFAPDVEQEWRWVTPGSVFAVLAWIGMSLLFGLYVDNFGNYDKVYGSIGAVIVLLTWMYLSGFVLLVGGEINAEIEHAAASGKDEGEKRLPASRGKRRAKSRRAAG